MAGMLFPSSSSLSFSICGKSSASVYICSSIMHDQFTLSRQRGKEWGREAGGTKEEENGNLLTLQIDRVYIYISKGNQDIGNMATSVCLFIMNDPFSLFIYTRGERQHEGTSIATLYPEAILSWSIIGKSLLLLLTSHTLVCVCVCVFVSEMALSPWNRCP